MESKAKLLLIDDDVTLLKALEIYMTRAGYEVFTAGNGTDGLKQLFALRPDLVILDVMMPGMTGWEVCRAIREDEALANTGVIMLTGIGERLNEMTSPLYGADDYIDKPFDFAVLESKIRGVLDKRAG